MGRTLTRDESLPSVVSSVTSKWAKGSGGPAGDECQNLVPTREGGFFDEAMAFDCKAGANTGFAIGELPGALRGQGHGGGHAAVALQEVGKRTGRSTNDTACGVGIAAEGAPMFTLQSGAQHGVGHGSAVRRLTPRECERLQGFADDYTRIPSALLRKLGIEPDPENPKHWAADGPRYKALGNSMAVPVMRWIGERIARVERVVPL